MRSPGWLLRGKAVALAAAAAILGTGAGLGPAQAWELKVCADPNNLPHSRLDMTGFENRIAQIIADDLGATLAFAWFPQGEQMVTDLFRVGECDVVMGVPDGQGGMLTTFSYYRSPFVFAYRADRGLGNLNSFDNPILATLKIGIQPSGGPTHQALLSRGLRDNITQTYDYLAWAYTGEDLQDPLAPIIDDIANGVIDVAILWGPAAGYYSAREPVDIVVAPVDPPFEPPFIPMFINMAMGVRLGDESLRDRLDIAIAETWEEIYAVLAEYNVPLMELPRPTLTIGGP
jgi:quinoprotein dehydrogenase-associated probable ABC transporter substrate-binding protein